MEMAASGPVTKENSGWLLPVDGASNQSGSRAGYVERETGMATVPFSRPWGASVLDKYSATRGWAPGRFADRYTTPQALFVGRKLNFSSKHGATRDRYLGVGSAS
ncbi:hypothetical protein CR513_32111, partial [Mucuna pruriens]